MREYNPSVGETWVSRNKKQQLVIIEVKNSGDMPVWAINEQKKILTFTRDGFFISKHFPNPLDLVERL